MRGIFLWENLNVDGTKIQVLQIEEDDYISLTDMVRKNTDAIKVNLIPLKLTPQQTSVIYASKADALNMALFGMILYSAYMNFIRCS